MRRWGVRNRALPPPNTHTHLWVTEWYPSNCDYPPLPFNSFLDPLCPRLLPGVEVLMSLPEQMQGRQKLFSGWMGAPLSHGGRGAEGVML